jgi:hypothetical protein
MAGSFSFKPNIKNLPWFLFDLANYQLITTITIPEGEIKDDKSIILAETPIPGRNFQPITPGGNGNRKISFTIPILRRNGVYGDVLIVKQFDALRNQSAGFFNKIKPAGQFTPNPKVLYFWGIGSVPLVYFVSKCSMRHVSSMVTAGAMPQLTYIDMELILDETHPLYKGEEMFRVYGGVLGNIDNALELIGMKYRI